MLRHVVLGLLTARPMHGYALAKEYQRRSGLEVPNGNLYRELQRLMATGLVRTADPAGRSDERKFTYEITDAGRAAFEAWLSHPKVLAPDHADEICARAVCLDEMDRGVTARVLMRWHEELWVRQKLLERSRDLAEAESSGSGGGETAVLLFTRRLQHVAADLEFVQALRAARCSAVSP